MRTALVFGGSGQIGEALIPHLLATGWRVLALSRRQQADLPQLQWLLGDCDQMPPLPAQVDCILSLGPLDRFAHWYAESDIVSPRVIAFGSTSVDSKHASMDAGERDLSRRLQQGETTVLQAALARAARATLLRPTLVYGAGRDQTLSRIAAMARRTGVFVLPAGARGLRQPVHVQDLAQAVLLSLDNPLATAGKAYALPGGETLPYRDMVLRTLAAIQPPARLLELPPMMFKAMLALAQALGRLRAINPAVLARMRNDLVFDAGPAIRDFGYAPRGFQPDGKALGQP